MGTEVTDQLGPKGYSLSVISIPDVEPLDTQFDVDAPKAVPDPLRDMLFGQTRPRPIASDPADVAELRTYAILDAAKLFGLPEMLEVSDLEHCCLFKGQAFEDLRDVGPWLVQLDEHSDFTRRLFTKEDTPFDLWDKELGIFVRSECDLLEMQSHFRKFTKVQNEDGGWLYWRFWEGPFLATALKAAEPAYREKFFMNGAITSVHYARARHLITFETLTLTN